MWMRQVNGESLYEYRHCCVTTALSEMNCISSQTTQDNEYLCLILHSLSHSGITTGEGKKMGRKTWRVVIKKTRDRTIEEHWESGWWNKTQIIDGGNCGSCQGRGGGQELRDVPSLDSNQITQGRENSWNVQNYRWRIFRRHTLTHIRTDTRTHVKTERRQQVKAFRNVCGKYLTF